MRTTWFMGSHIVGILKDGVTGVPLPSATNRILDYRRGGAEAGSHLYWVVS